MRSNARGGDDWLSSHKSKAFLASGFFQTIFAKTTLSEKKLEMACDKLESSEKQLNFLVNQYQSQERFCWSST